MENFLNLNFSERILSENLFQVWEIQGSGEIKIIGNTAAFLVFSNLQGDFLTGPTLIMLSVSR